MTLAHIDIMAIMSFHVMFLSKDLHLHRSMAVCRGGWHAFRHLERPCLLDSL